MAFVMGVRYGESDIIELDLKSKFVLGKFLNITSGHHHLELLWAMVTALLRGSLINANSYINFGKIFSFTISLAK